MTKIKFEICLAKFGHKPDEKFDFLFVFNMLCHVSAFSILCIYMTLPLKKEVVKLSHLPCDGKNFPSRIHISLFPPRAAGSLCNNRTFNSPQGQLGPKGQ